jgi:hypothetical protein
MPRGTEHEREKHALEPVPSIDLTTDYFPT